MIELTIAEVQFQNRAFLSHLSELLRKKREGTKEVQGASIEDEIRKTENRINDLKDIVKLRIHGAG